MGRALNAYSPGTVNSISYVTPGILKSGKRALSRCAIHGKCPAGRYHTEMSLKVWPKKFWEKSMQKFFIEIKSSFWINKISVSVSVSVRCSTPVLAMFYTNSGTRAPSSIDYCDLQNNHVGSDSTASFNPLCASLSNHRCCCFQ